jgi:hypothetical protein
MRWARSVIYDARVARDRAGGAELSADAINAIYSGAVASLRRAAVRAAESGGQALAAP